VTFLGGQNILWPLLHIFRGHSRPPPIGSTPLVLPSFEADVFKVPRVTGQCRGAGTWVVLVSNLWEIVCVPFTSECLNSCASRVLNCVCYLHKERVFYAPFVCLSLSEITQNCWTVLMTFFGGVRCVTLMYWLPSDGNLDDATLRFGLRTRGGGLPAQSAVSCV